MSHDEVSAQIALNKFLQTVKDAAAEDPKLRSRLVEALDLTVLYEGEEQFVGADPLKQANRWSEDAFTRIWSKATVGQIKAALKDHGLATNSDMSKKKKPELIELLYRRASRAAQNDGRI